MTGKIIVQGKECPLRFGMSVVEALAARVGEPDLSDSDATIFLIYHAHLCYCSSRRIAPSFEYWDIVDFVEIALASKKPEMLSQITESMKLYNDSTIIQDLLKDGAKEIETGADKKKLTSYSTESPPTENLG